LEQILFSALKQIRKKTSTPPNEEIVSSTTTITVESDPEVQIRSDTTTASSPEHEGNNKDKREQQEEEEEEEIGECHRLKIDIPQNLMDKVTKRPNIDRNDRSGSFSSKYAIWDEGDSYIIENYDGEDIHVIPSSSHNTPPQEQNRSYFSRRKNTNSTGGSSGSPGSPGSHGDSLSSQQEQSRIGGFFNRGSPTTKSV